MSLTRTSRSLRQRTRKDDRPYGGEIDGRPAAADHDQPLRSAFILSWNVPNLTLSQRATVVVARWNEKGQAWAYTSEQPVWNGTPLTAAVRDLSILNWFADIGQTGIGHRHQGRRTEMQLKQAAIMVTGTVAPDQDLSASAIRVCLEPAKESSANVRVANNGPFGQQMSMVHGGQQWAQTSGGR